jgi:hypothetical protein
MKQICDFMQDRGTPCTPGKYTSKELFTDLGFGQYDDIDFNSDEGVTIVHDMNTPLPAGLATYDLVMECGTIEHIFDISQVFKNMIQLCDVGGSVLHISPLNWLNHGFWNFSLTAFYDVYRVNGFENPQFWLMNWPKNYSQVGSSPVLKIDFTPAHILPPPQSDFLMVAFTAKKKESVPFKIPIQAAYDPELKLNTYLKNNKD